MMKYLTIHFSAKISTISSVTAR